MLPTHLAFPPTFRLTLPLIVVFILVVLLPARISAQPTPSPTPFKPPEESLNRYTLASTSSPLTVATSAEAIPHFHALLRFISSTEAAVTTSIKESLDASSDDGLTTCNDRDLEWRQAVTTYFGLRHWPPPDMTCVTNVYSPGETAPDFPVDRVYDLVRRAGEDLARVATEVAAATGRTWPDATRGTDFVYNVRTQGCTHDYAAFVRLDGAWYLETRLTNEDKDRTLIEGKREYLWEYVRADPRRMLPPAKVYVAGSYGTTVFANLSGSVPASGFGTIFPTDNLAIAEALAAGEHANQQAIDATTTSNIAILALPLAMNLVPVAVIADVNSLGMLMYTLATDVLTCVPLAIKGVEVLSVGLRRETKVVTRITGVDDGVKAAEVWTARCITNAELRPVGIALLVVALVFMIGGVAAEFIAREVVTRRRRRAKAAEGQAGAPPVSAPLSATGTSAAVVARGSDVAWTIGAVGPKSD